MNSLFLYKKIYLFHTINGDYMKNKKYEKIVEANKADETRVQNAIVAFLSGGLVGAIGERII